MCLLFCQVISMSQNEKNEQRNKHTVSAVNFKDLQKANYQRFERILEKNLKVFELIVHIKVNTNLNLPVQKR